MHGPSGGGMLTNVENLDHVFEGLDFFNESSLGRGMSPVKRMFHDSSFFNQDISSGETSIVARMEEMFFTKHAKR